MTAFTTAAAGDIQTAANWTGGILPDFTIAGDTWTLNHAMTNVADWSVGGGGAATVLQLLLSATGSLNHSNGRLSVQCSIGFQGGAMGQFTITQPGSLRFVGGANICYAISPSASGGTTCGITFAGTSGSQVTVDSAASSSGRFSNSNPANTWAFGIDAQYTNFANIGKLSGGASDDNGYAFDVTMAGAGQKFRMSHCTDTNCGGKYIAPAATSDVIVEYHKTVSPNFSINSTDWLFSGTRSTTGVRTLQYSSMLQSALTWNATSLHNWTIQWIAATFVNFTGNTDTNPPTTMQGFFVYALNKTQAWGGPGHTVSMVACLVDGTTTPFSSYVKAGDTGTFILDNVAVQCTDPGSSQDGSSYGSPSASATMTYSNRRYINLKGAGGFSSGGIVAEHGNKFLINDVRHVTQNVVSNTTGVLNVMMGAAAYYGQAGSIARCEDSIWFQYGAMSGGLTSFVVEHYPNADIAESPRVVSGAGASYGSRFTSTAGSTATVIQCSTKAWDTAANEKLADAVANLVVTNNHSIAGAPAVGESAVISNNTATAITVTGGFTGSVWDGVDYDVIVVDQITPANYRNNYYFGAIASGTNWDSAGQNATTVLGMTGMHLSTFSTNVNSVNGGAGSDPIGSGPQFLLEEVVAGVGWDIITADQDFMGFSADPLWVTAHSYVIGDYVSHSSSDFFVSRIVNFYCYVAHTSSSTNDVNEPGKRPGSSNYRNFWRPAAVERIANALIADTRYSNPNILYLGDTANTPATNINALEMDLSRIRHAKRPTNATLLAMAANSQDGICPGAVDGNIPLPSSGGLVFQNTIYRAGP